MPAKPKKNRVTRGNARITIYRWTHPTTGAKRWRFAHRTPDGKWRYVTSETLADAEAAAERVMIQIRNRWRNTRLRYGS